jgi:acyl carrier protein
VADSEQSELYRLIMNWFTVLFFAACLAFMIWVSLLERRKQHLYAESFDRRQKQRADCPKSELFADPEFRRVCRALASVAEQAMSPPGVHVDPERLKPSDTLGEDLGFSLDSLAYANLICQLEKEFGRKLRWRDFQQAETIHDIYDILFPDKLQPPMGRKGLATEQSGKREPPMTRILKS